MIHLNLSAINCVHVLVATLAYFILGALWYSKVMFLKPWMAANNINPETVDKSGMMKSMIMGFISTFIICYAVGVLEYIIGIGGGRAAIKLGLLVGVGFFMIPSYMNSVYQKQSMKLLMINGGYHTAGIIIAAIILAKWM